ncbi:hypothetical protein HK100_008287, partial [Physocladia obscura]
MASANEAIIILNESLEIQRTLFSLQTQLTHGLARVNSVVDMVAKIVGTASPISPTLAVDQRTHKHSGTGGETKGASHINFRRDISDGNPIDASCTSANDFSSRYGALQQISALRPSFQSSTLYGYRGASISLDLRPQQQQQQQQLTKPNNIEKTTINSQSSIKSQDIQILSAGIRWDEIDHIKPVKSALIRSKSYENSAMKLNGEAVEKSKLSVMAGGVSEDSQISPLSESPDSNVFQDFKDCSSICATAGSTSTISNKSSENFWQQQQQQEKQTKEARRDQQVNFDPQIPASSLLLPTTAFKKDATPQEFRGEFSSGSILRTAKNVRRESTLSSPHSSHFSRRTSGMTPDTLKSHHTKQSILMDIDSDNYVSRIPESPLQEKNISIPPVLQSRANVYKKSTVLQRLLLYRAFDNDGTFIATRKRDGDSSEPISLFADGFHPQSIVNTFVNSMMI